MALEIFTIGHSTHSAERFVELLKAHGITAVADVRSQPYSRTNPQFNRESLRKTLEANGIEYVFLGKELGARTDDPGCYVGGKVQYDRLARTESFNVGLDRVLAGAQRYRIALMCAEKEPLGCHRTILVSRHLIARGVRVAHILDDGAIETHEQALDRLREQLKLPAGDMFRSPEDILEEVYRVQGERIAYRRPDSER